MPDTQTRGEDAKAHEVVIRAPGYPDATWSGFKSVETGGEIVPSAVMGYLAFDVRGKPHRIPCVLSAEDAQDAELVIRTLWNGMNVAKTMVEQGEDR